MYFDLGNILVFFILGFVFVAVMLGLGKLVRPDNPNPAKLATYECGEPPAGNAWINFNIRFYLFALVFLIFDVELAFMYPVLAVYRDWLARGQALVALTEIVLFMAVLFLGLAYVWMKRDLEWMKRVPEDDESVQGPSRHAA